VPINEGMYESTAFASCDGDERDTKVSEYDAMAIHKIAKKLASNSQHLSISWPAPLLEVEEEVGQISVSSYLH